HAVGAGPALALRPLELVAARGCGARAARAALPADSARREKGRGPLARLSRRGRRGALRLRRAVHIRNEGKKVADSPWDDLLAPSQGRLPWIYRTTCC